MILEAIVDGYSSYVSILAHIYVCERLGSEDVPNYHFYTNIRNRAVQIERYLADEIDVDLHNGHIFDIFQSIADDIFRDGVSPECFFALFSVCGLLA